VDANNHHLVKPQLLLNCKKEKIPNINPSEELCGYFPNIFQWWEIAFDRPQTFKVPAGTTHAPSASFWDQHFEWQACDPPLCDAASTFP
jgi:hypothetical protein